MVRIKDAFERQHPGVEVRMEYDGSGKLLGRLVTAKAPEYRPDIYVAGDALYGEKAREQDLVDRTETLATFRPVIARVSPSLWVTTGRPPSARRPTRCLNRPT
jgi:ABC-type molybdate transport system substrate-binding protein